MLGSDPEYDTDAISLTSTVPSDSEKYYDIKCILSEGLDEQPDGHRVMKYLIEWDEYPMHACTWEPEDNLLDTELLGPWAEIKAGMGRKKFAEYCQKNKANFERARAEFIKLQRIRGEKRAKKRNKLRERNKSRERKKPFIQSDDSEEDIPLSQQTRATRPNARFTDTDPTQGQETCDSLFVGSHDSDALQSPPVLNLLEPGLLSARPSPIEQLVDDIDALSPVRGPAKSQLDELAAKAAKDNLPKVTLKSRGNNKESNLRESVLSKTRPLQKATKPPGKPATDKSSTQTRIPVQHKPSDPKETLDALNTMGPKEPSRRLSEATSQVPLTQESNMLVSKPSNGIVRSTSILKPTKPVVPGRAQKTSFSVAPRNTSNRIEPVSNTSKPIRLMNQTKERPVRRERNTRNMPFQKVKYRRLAEQRARAEGTPDFDMLEFVGVGPPTKARPQPSDLVDNVFSRREMGARRTEVERTPRPEKNTMNEENPRKAWEKDKIPLICADWRLNSNCQFTAEKCKFMHRTKHPDGHDLPIAPIDGSVPAKYRNPPLTCLFYLRKPEGCLKTADQCGYAHYNTGFLPRERINPNEIPISEQQSHRILKQHRKRTCWYWANGNRCRKTAETCDYQHYDTSVVTPAPVAKVPRPDLFIPSASFEREPIEDTDMHKNDVDLLMTSTIPPVEAGQTQPHCVRSPLSAVNKGPITLSLPITLPPAVSTCLQLKDSMEEALKTNLVGMFQWRDHETQGKMIDHTAFLAYHPLYHLEELELITRWLLMLHVEVSNAWFEGAWKHWMNRVRDTCPGIIILHPDFEYFSELEGFGALLRKNIRVWSLGVQEGPHYDPFSSFVPSRKQHECIEMFPAGGFICITDDVFESRPRQALKIIKLFIAKIQKLRPSIDPESPWQEADNINLHWRLCVRPELMQYLYDRCEEQVEDLEAEDSNAFARAELYTLLSDTDYIEQDSTIMALSLRPDKFPIMSERCIIAEGEPMNYFDTLAHSPEKANLRMIQYYAGLHIIMRRDYRHFYIVHTDPSGASAKQWQSECKTITDILTPEQCIAELVEDGKDKEEERLFDFYERWLVPPEDEGAVAAHDEEVMRVQREEFRDSQTSLEGGEIRCNN